MKVKRLILWLSITTIFIVLVACASIDTESGVQSRTLQDINWRLVQLRDTVSSEDADPFRQPALMFLPEGRVAGSDGCNRLMGGYHEQGQQLRFTQLASTLMACVDGMETADKFNRLITEVRRYHIKEGVLELFSDSGELLMRFHSEEVAGSR